MPDRKLLGRLGRWLGGGWPGDAWHRAAMRGGGWLSAPDIYWRRRFFTLAGGLVVVGVIAWGLSVLVGPARPFAATRSAARAPMSARPSALATATPPASQPGSGAAFSPAQSPSAQAGTCSPASIVYSLFTSQPQYGPHQQPRFEVDAVSTAPGTCSMAYDASLVRVVVTLQGQVIWDSTACKAPAAAAAATVSFAQGVPQVARVTWNRKAADPACAGSAPAAANGTFEAVAMAGGRSTPVLSFTLLR